MLFYTNPNDGKLDFKRLDGEVLMDDILCIEEIKTPEDMEWAVERLCGCIEEAVHDWYHDVYEKPDNYDHCYIEVYYDQEDYKEDEGIIISLTYILDIRMSCNLITALTSLSLK